MRLWGRLVLVGASVAGAMGGAMLAGAAYLLRRRTPDPFDPPTNYDLTYEEVAFFARDGVKLRGWWIPAPDAPATDVPTRTVIVCPGQEGSIDGDTAQVVPLHHAGFNVLMFDFRGHGRSDGALVTMGIREKDDLLSAVEYLVRQRGVERVGVLGFSMGAAAALMAAAENRQIVSVVADSSYTSLELTVRRWAEGRRIPAVLHMPIVAGTLTLASLLSGAALRNARPLEAAGQLGERPALFIYGERDPLVKGQEMRQWLRVAPRGDLWIVPGVGHREAYRAAPDAYNRRVVAWFEHTL
jgi:pimeloyl-ACP methyl ester carboxylesterase